MSKKAGLVRTDEDTAVWRHGVLDVGEHERRVVVGPHVQDVSQLKKKTCVSGMRGEKAQRTYVVDVLTRNGGVFEEVDGYEGDTAGAEVGGIFFLPFLVHGHQYGQKKHNAEAYRERKQRAPSWHALSGLPYPVA